MARISVRANKALGQHFLTDTYLVDQFVNEIDPRPGQTMVEIGPGTGCLTEAVLPCIKKLDVIELDNRVIPDLLKNCEGLGELSIHKSDALKFDFASLGGSLRVIGNLPYQITSPLIFKLLENRGKIEDMHFLLQKEVVQRMAAHPGDSNYGRLSVMLQFYCKVEELHDAPPEAFTPPPKVMSQFVRIIPYKELPFKVNDEHKFAAFIKQAFSQRRKTLRNVLKKLVTLDQFEKAGVNPQARPQEIGVEGFVKLFLTT